jgi:hypothetical protein
MASHGYSRWTSWLIPLAGIVIAGCVAPGKPLPALLDGATAHGGWVSACPAQTEAERQIIVAAGGIAGSTELEQRLRNRFPGGSSNDDVVAALQAQGFQLDKPCASDETIQRASFEKKGVDVSATIYWKLDEQSRMVWIKGIIVRAASL